MNWKKQFDSKFPNETYDSKGTCHCVDIKSFISTEIIEKIIKDFEENLYVGKSNYRTIGSSLVKIKIKQLRDKWL